MRLICGIAGFSLITQSNPSTQSGSGVLGGFSMLLIFMSIFGDRRGMRR